VNWGTNAANTERPYIAKTIIPELPFFPNTTYGGHFADTKGKPAKLLNPKTNKSPLSPGIPFLGES